MKQMKYKYLWMYETSEIKYLQIYETNDMSRGQTALRNKTFVLFL
jgi:hypothetical protein